MKFADFAVGQVIEAGPYVVDEAEVLSFAKAYDPQWFHTDPEAAAKGRFGGLIASGWHTCDWRRMQPCMAPNLSRRRALPT
jgi:acyl dehydratase